MRQTARHTSVSGIPMVTCWKCGCDLGPQLEHQKMVTEKGPICYTCFNMAQEEADQKKDTRKDPGR